jgi:hypothetical protein
MMAISTLVIPIAALHAANDSGPQSTAQSAPVNVGVGNMSCPPQFLTDPERRQYAKDGAIRSGPWHTRCFQNGTSIYDRDHIYVYCSRGDTNASIESGDGHAIRFQFPPEVACVWER